ncbi:hypothetical protein [Streptomyces sp. NBC_01244]|uniref:hypothetical protein n=1 Tax=Streptomyces sp. NBC_01244 TaxID=2903797 RepID=UPI002E0ED484|nr:hypothetical protein OG247_05095 [Streptomyces sp. NBC_01244]
MTTRSYARPASATAISPFDDADAGRRGSGGEVAGAEGAVQWGKGLAGGVEKGGGAEPDHPAVAGVAHCPNISMSVHLLGPEKAPGPDCESRMS